MSGSTIVAPLDQRPLPTIPATTESHHYIHTRTADGFDVLQLTGVALVNLVIPELIQGDSYKAEIHIPLPLSDILPSGKGIQVEGWTVVVNPAAVHFDPGNGGWAHATDAIGFAVDNFEIWHPNYPTRSLSVKAYTTVFGRKSTIWRLTYDVTLVGTIGDNKDPIIE